MDEALQFVSDNSDKSFFAFLPLTIPHAAMHAPEDAMQPWREKFPQFEEKIGKYRGPEVRNPIAAFAAMMTLMDAGIGELLSLLAELKIDENTIVLFSSDNGPHKEGGHDPDFFDSNGPLKGYKRDVYEGGIRNALIARWPGKIAAGSVSDHISAHWDMLSTFCELAGIDSPPGLDGISMVAELTGTGKQKAHEFLYWEFYERGGKRAVRFDDWKAIQQNLKGPNQKDGVELYSLSDDIGEETNVADQHPEVVARALEYFAAAHTPSEFWRFGARKKKVKK